MSDDDDAPKPSSGLMSPLGIAGLVAIAIPLTFSMASSSSTTINGVEVQSEYFDPVAVFAGGAGVLLGLLLAVIGRGQLLGRVVAALIIMAIGTRHLTHGLGIEINPLMQKQVKSNGAPFGKPPAPVAVCDEDTPDTCAALCDKGDADACDELGVAYIHGTGGLAEDPDKAEPFFIKACELKDPQGCQNAGLFFLQGLGKTIDGAKALEFSKQGCALKSAASCNFAGAILADGKGVEGDKVAAQPFFAQACEGGFAAGCENAGNAYRDGKGAERDQAKAVELYEKGCEKEGADSCNEAGVIFEDDDFPQRDEKKAMGFFERGCQLKSPYGCSNFGRRLAKTEPAKAIDPLDTACTLNRGRACEDLGLLLYKGAEGVEKNLSEARRVFITGCKSGHLNSCTNAGIMASVGEGGPVNFDEASELLKEPCDAKDEKACARLGVALAAFDPASAKPLLTAGCKAKFTDACDELKKLGGKGGKKGKKK